MFARLRERQEKIGVIGLGYVGLPLAVEFAKKFEVIGFDINKIKIEKYLSGDDVTSQIGNETLTGTSVVFTSDEGKLKECKFLIVAVPTPINSDKTPDLASVVNASKAVGRNLTRGSIVVYESTVYPGTTEEVCIPILEKESGLKCGVDFKVGYSPERINPGDKVHTLANIVKIVSGSDNETLDTISKVYGSIITAGVYKAESIRVAEAAKVVENSQRDINIAFMNELSMVFDEMDIDTKAVLEAAGTKWNFLKFSPGLVGGHCIGVDPYYFIYKAEQLGYHSQIILSGRKINDGMGKYIAEKTVKKLIQAGRPLKGARVAIFGIAFKENCSDSRNTKVVDIVEELKSYQIDVKVVDPIVSKEEVLQEYRIKLDDIKEIKDIDAAIFAVSHKEFLDIDLNELRKLYRTNCDLSAEALDEASVTTEADNRMQDLVLMDVKGIFDRKEAEEMSYLYWRL